MNLAKAPEAVDDTVVRIRRPQPADAPAVLAAVEVSRPELQAWMPWCTPAYALEDAQAWIALSAKWPDGPLCPFVIESVADGELLGSTGIDVEDGLDHAHKLGYWVRSDRTGRGLARRAARLAARFGFEHLGAQRIAILMAVDNDRSRRVAEAIGARQEGRMRSRFLLEGVRHDAWLYALLPGELRGAP